MQYNTQKTTIEITEYGRNIQQLLLRANDITAADERLAYVEKVLDAMYAINPQVRITEDYRSKLWSHAFRITNYTLDVEPPFGITLDAQEDFFHKRPQRIAYPSNIVKFRHYGKNISTLIAKAIATEDAEKREEFTQFIASFMKMAQINYNREGVSDEIIRRDLHDLSNGKLSLDAETNIQDIARGNRVVLDEKPKTRRGKRGGKNKKQATANVSTNTNTQNSNNNRNNNNNNNNNRNDNRNEPKQNRNENQKTQPQVQQQAQQQVQQQTQQQPKQRIQQPKQVAQNNVKTTENAPKPQQQAKQEPKQAAKPRVQQAKQSPKAENPKTENLKTEQSDASKQTPEGATKKRRRGGRGRGGKGKKAE
jgi:Domain of unknown function (DUF4290)